MTGPLTPDDMRSLRKLRQIHVTLTRAEAAALLEAIENRDTEAARDARLAIEAALKRASA
jgi:hypothetical protein